MPVKILCAGTSNEVFDFVKRNLSLFECEVVKATSLGLALFLSHKNYPSVILSQVELNEGSALDFLREVKTEPDLAEIPFILLTNDSTGEIPTETNADKVLSYPLSDAAFLAEMVPLLKIRQDNREEETTE